MTSVYNTIKAQHPQDTTPSMEKITLRHIILNHCDAQENKVGLLSHIGRGMKTPLSLRERAALALTGSVMGTATARHFLNSVQNLKSN